RVFRPRRRQAGFTALWVHYVHAQGGLAKRGPGGRDQAGPRLAGRLRYRRERGGLGRATLGRGARTPDFRLPDGGHRDWWRWTGGRALDARRAPPRDGPHANFAQPTGRSFPGSLPVSR